MTKEPYIAWRTVRFGDTDPAGIVYTPRFGDYSLEAIESWLNDVIDLNWAHINLNEGMGTPFVHMELDFIAKVYANDRLGVAVRIEKIGRTSLTVSLEGLRQPPQSDMTEQAFTAKFVMCFIKNDAGPIPIPDRNRQKLEAYQAETKD